MSRARGSFPSFQESHEWRDLYLALEPTIAFLPLEPTAKAYYMSVVDPSFYCFVLQEEWCAKLRPLTRFYPFWTKPIRSCLTDSHEFVEMGNSGKERGKGGYRQDSAYLLNIETEYIVFGGIIMPEEFALASFHSGECWQNDSLQICHHPH